MKNIKTFLVVLLLILSFNSYSGVGRFNLSNGCIGIQTSHESRFHAHLEVHIFPYSLFQDIDGNGCSTQLGYVWYIDDEIALRSGWEGSVWGLYTPEEECINYRFYSNIVPIGGSIYPFNDVEYIGFDLYTLVNINKGTFGVGGGIVVRF